MPRMVRVTGAHTTDGKLLDKGVIELGEYFFPCHSHMFGHMTFRSNQNV